MTATLQLDVKVECYPDKLLCSIRIGVPGDTAIKTSTSNIVMLLTARRRLVAGATNPKHFASLKFCKLEKSVNFQCHSFSTTTASVEHLREKRLKSRDHVLRHSFSNIRVSIVHANDTISEAKRRWNLTDAQASTWGSYMIGSVMLSSLFKGEERVKTSIELPSEQIYVESICCGEVRGGSRAKEIPNKEHNIISTNGLMKVQKILYGQKSPYETVVMASGDATDDWQTYFDISDQVDTFISINKSRGLLLQKMPPASKKSEDNSKNNNTDLSYKALVEGPHTTNVAELLDNETDTTFSLLKQLDTKLSSISECRVTPLDYFCRCTKEAAAAPVLNLTPEQRAAEGITDTFQTTCHFCNKVYDISL